MGIFKKQSSARVVDNTNKYQIIQLEDTSDEPFHLQIYKPVYGHYCPNECSSWKTIAIFKTIEEANIYCDEIKNGARNAEGIKIVSTFETGSKVFIKELI